MIFWVCLKIGYNTPQMTIYARRKMMTNRGIWGKPIFRQPHISVCSAVLWQHGFRLARPNWLNRILSPKKKGSDLLCMFPSTNALNGSHTEPYLPVMLVKTTEASEIPTIQSPSNVKRDDGTSD